MKRFYKPTDTPEIWDRIQVYLSPRYSTKEFCDLALLFLSVKMTTDEHRSYGAGLWFDTMWKMYEVVEMGDKWGSELPNLFATLAYNNPDFMDWTSLYDTIFTRTIRAMGLSIREGKVTVGDGTGATSLSGLARMVVATLGGPYSCQQHLGRMMKVVEPFMHPSNESAHTLLVLAFLHSILQELVNRYIEERVKKHKREVPTRFYLTDDDIANFTDAILQSLLYALYVKQGSTSKTPAKLVMILAALCPGRVLPRFFEHTYPAMCAVDQPHRLTQTLDCLFELVFLIARDNDPSLKRLKMEKDWIKKLEKIRSPLSPIAEYSLNKLSRSLGFNIRDRLSTFRCHLFYFLEMLIEGIDINDVSKANITIHNLTLIFYITPILDYSDCVKYHTDLTDEEKALCKMSARLPVLAEMALNKMLEIIQCLSITAPKDSSTVIGGFKDAATMNGSEEKVLKKAIDRCVTAMCKNANSSVTSKLGRKMLQFVKTNQFESSLATDMISSMMASMTYELPSFWILFAKHVLHNLRIVLTPEVKKAEDLDATASWFVSLASSLLATTSENYINHKDICFEMIDLLVTCKSRVAYASGSVGLWNSMYMLSRVYPENSRYMSEKLDRSLKEWVPIREWGRLYEIKDMKMAWHIPNNRGNAVVEEMLKKFLFPVMDLVNSVEVDRETLKKSFTIINSIFTGGATCFSLPSSPLFHSPSTALPWFNANIPNAAVFKLDVRHPSNRNVREMLVELIENVINKTETCQREHSQVLITICSMLHYLIHTNYIDSSELSMATEIKDEIFTYLTDPVKKGYPSYVYESLVYVCHMKNATATSSPFTEFHLRVVRLLTRLSLNVYAEVRLAAQAELALVFAEYTLSSEAMIDSVIPVLTDQEASKEKIRGALNVILKSKWATDTRKSAKMKVWQALLDMNTIEMPAILKVFEEICNDIGNMQKPSLKHYKCEKLLSFCEKMFEKLPKTSEWQKFNCKNSLDLTRQIQEKKRNKSKAEQKALVEMLLQRFANKDMLHTRVKLCRTMLWRCQMENSRLETIKIILSKFTDEDQYHRERSADELSFWLKKNKALTIRMDWICPKKPQESIPLKCGIRADNMALIYDSENLPNTEEKWNNTVFFSKQFGCYKWPKTISVVVPAKHPQVNRPKLTECEAEILSTFENMEVYSKWIEQLLFEKGDSSEINGYTIWIVKYTLRSFAHSTIIFDRFTKTLQELLKSRQRAEQRLAAEFFAGVAMGTKYYGFSVLNKLWSWLAPAVDLLYDYLNEDAYFSWHFCMTNVLHRDDTRRYWWLIEELLKGMARTAPTAWHHAVALKNVCVVLDANMNNDFRGLPNRFHLESVDFWLQRFEGNLGETPNIKSRLASETVIQFGGGVKANELAPKFMAVHSSSSMVDLSQIYLRTLLEFLLQYYTDCITCLTPRIVSLFPVLLEYANEGDNDIYGSFKDMDISHSASLLIHEEMSTLQLTPKFADSFLNVVVQSFYTSYLWRVKVSVLKFIQVLVFSNIYELEKATRREKILKLLYDAIVDPQTEVRREASRAMLTLILCGYIEVNDDLSKYFNNLMKNKNLSTIHGAILGMGAVVRAHPFSTPLAIKPMLAALCEVTSHNAELQKAATTALREFRRTHRDNWQKVAKILGPDLVYKIENAIAPVYYA
ncbi:hypothetical protein Angca_004885 [Angiostrongylus cantonensis]|nr:hypothetical protein Angca_004885 [Angiostrongylus cantonensis]